MSGATDRIDWIAVDWGSSNLRAWAIGADGGLLAEATSADGAAGLAPDGFEPALLAVSVVLFTIMTAFYALHVTAGMT